MRYHYKELDKNEKEKSKENMNWKKNKQKIDKLGL